jgi:hypothetical protein
MANWFVNSVSGVGGTGNGSSWANAYLTLVAAFAGTGIAAGDTFFVGDNHAESTAAAITLNSPGTLAAPCYVISVDHTVASPGPGNVLGGAHVTTTGAFGMNIQTVAGSTYFNGITFNSGTGASAGASIIMNGTAITGDLVFENCTLAIISTNLGATVQSNASNGGFRVFFYNTKIQFSNLQQGLTLIGTNFTWRGGSIAGTITSQIIGTNSARSLIAVFEGVDFSLTNTTFTPALPTCSGVFIVKDCFLNPALTFANPSQPGYEVFVQRSDSAGTNWQQQKWAYAGSQVVEGTVVRTGGASDGSKPISWKLTTTANVQWVHPYEAIQTTIWNASLSGSVTVSLEGISPTTLPNNDEIWMDVECLGSASSPLGSVTNTTKANVLAAGIPVQASTKAWDSLAPVRQNSFTYAVNAVIKTASNPGRVFFCTTGGASSGSEPVGYATAVDGSSVTDGAATFRAGSRFTLSLLVHPAQAGDIYVTPKMARPSALFYIDPSITLS